MFRAKRADRVKILWWDGTGLCLFAKRLERRRSGYGVCVSHDGAASEPFQVPPETIAAMLAALESGKKQKGGAKTQPTSEEAHLQLGDVRPPDIMAPPGLDALNIFWAGNSIVQSRANADNQPAPPLPPANRSSSSPQPSSPQPQPSPKPEPPPPAPPRREQITLEPTPFFISIETIEPRKANSIALDAF